MKYTMPCGAAKVKKFEKNENEKKQNAFPIGIFLGVVQDVLHSLPVIDFYSPVRSRREYVSCAVEGKKTSQSNRHLH